MALGRKESGDRGDNTEQSNKVRTADTSASLSSFRAMGTELQEKACPASL